MGFFIRIQVKLSGNFTLPFGIQLRCFNGIIIPLWAARPILVWKAGSVCTLLEAWDSGLFTKDDIAEISKSKNDGTVLFCEGCNNCKQTAVP